MKLKHLLIVLAVTFILYLAGSFIAMEFNPKNWAELGRAFATFSWLAFIGVFIGVIDEIESKEK